MVISSGDKKAFTGRVRAYIGGAGSAGAVILNE